MGRAPRIEGEGLWYHVYNRGNEKRPVFLTDKDYMLFLDTLFETSKRYNVEVHAYAVMSNHFHIMLKTHQANLCRFMHHAMSVFTRTYNAAHERVGHLWQGRYQAIVVDSEAYGRELLRYIHLNPARVPGVAERGVQERKQILDEYAWTSHRAYAGGGHVPWPVVTSELLHSFGTTLGEQRRNYVAFMCDGLGGSADVFEHVLGKAVLGSQAFIARITELVKRGRRDATAASERQRITACSVSDVVAAVCHVYKCSEADVLRRYPPTHCKEARRVLLWAAAQYCRAGSSLAQLGRQLGGISSSAFNRARTRLLASAARQVDVARRMQAVNARVTAANTPQVPVYLDKVWREMYQRLVMFFRRHGHCNVRRADDAALASWVAAQRRMRHSPAAKGATLLPEQIALLDQLHFTWK